MNVNVTKSRWFVVLGLVFLSVNLRPAVVSVSPLLELIRSDLGLSYSTVSLLTVVPIFCIGFFALFVPKTEGRFSHETGTLVGVCLIGIATGTRLLADSALLLFTTTVLIGVGIATTQTLLPPLVKAYFPNRVAFATGLYTASLGLGSTIASGMTVPIYQFLGSWTAALSAWALLAICAIVAWVPVCKNTAGKKNQPSEPSTPSLTGTKWLPWHSSSAWIITFLFVLNVSVYYSFLTWLAPYYVTLGWGEDRAGFLLTIFILSGLGGMLTLSVVGDQHHDRRLWLVPLLLISIVGSAGVAFVPELFSWLWAVMTGFGVGGWFTIVLIFPIDYTENEAAASKVSSMAHGGGYMVGAITPFVIGRSHDVFTTLTPAFVALVMLTIIGLLVSFSFSPEKPPIEV